MRKEPLQPPLAREGSLRAVIGRGALLWGGMGDKIVFGLGNKSDGGVVVGEVEWGGPRKWYGKKEKVMRTVMEKIQGKEEEAS